MGEQPGSLGAGAIAAVALLGFAYFARALVVPLVVALFVAYSLAPLVELLVARARLPRLLAALLTLLAAAALLGGVGFVAVRRAIQLSAELPRYEEAARGLFARVAAHVSALEQLRDRIDSSGPIHRVALASSWSTWMVDGFGRAAELAAETVAVVFLALLLLADGPRLRARLVAAVDAGADPAEGPRRTAAALEAVDRAIRSYLGARVALSAGLAAALAAAYALYGLDYALLWGLLTGVLTFVPYLGSALGALPPALMAALQFGTPARVAGALAIYFGLLAIEGNVIGPIVLGRRLKMSPVAVLAACLFFAWLWGPVGLILAVPIAASIKAACDRSHRWRSVGHLLGA
jgi:predicted PurR-regulated permease PerM